MPSGRKKRKAPCDEVSSYGAFSRLSLYRLPPFFQRPQGAQPSLFAIHYISKSLFLVSLAFLFLSWYFYIRNKSINHKEGYYYLAQAAGAGVELDVKLDLPGAPGRRTRISA